MPRQPGPLPDDGLAPARLTTPVEAAYRLHRKGRYYWNKRSKEGLSEGLQCFERSLEKDPSYALVYAGLADSYSQPGNYGVLLSHTVRAKAKDAAVKAVEMDPTLAEAHTSMGHAVATYDWDWEQAEREFELAIQLNPAYATRWHSTRPSMRVTGCGVWPRSNGASSRRRG